MLSLLVLTVVPALLLTAPALWWHYRRAAGERAAGAEGLRNPTQLGTALAFAGFYALVLLAAAWLSDVFGSSGLFGLSFVSGLTDVDAITLSSSRLAAQGSIGIEEAAAAVTLAVIANVAFKAAVSAAVGGRTLGRAALISFALPLGGLLGGLSLLHALA
jgi:uncharacterized membrane protein (DUF4010 family)